MITINANSLLAFLQTQAAARTAANGHTLSHWYQAKRKIGPKAWRATCKSCGLDVFILPQGNGQKGIEDHPAMRGEAVFEGCSRKG